MKGKKNHYYGKKHTEEIKQHFASLAISHNVNIIAGSMPIVEENKLYNISYLLHRAGKVDSHKKIQVTPYEREHYNMEFQIILKFQILKIQVVQLILWKYILNVELQDTI